MDFGDNLKIDLLESIIAIKHKHSEQKLIKIFQFVKVKNVFKVFKNCSVYQLICDSSFLFLNILFKKMTILKKIQNYVNKLTDTITLDL